MTAEAMLKGLMKQDRTVQRQRDRRSVADYTNHKPDTTYRRGRGPDQAPRAKRAPASEETRAKLSAAAKRRRISP